MGEGSEYFGLKEGLSASSKQSAWLPWTVLDRLVLELRENSGHPGVQNVLGRLQATIGAYQNLVDTVSRDMVSIRAG